MLCYADIDVTAATAFKFSLDFLSTIRLELIASDYLKESIYF